MAKLGVAAAIAVLLVSTSASLGVDGQTASASFGYNPDLGTVAQKPITEDLDLIPEQINDIPVQVEKKVVWCLKKLSHGGDGKKCVREVVELLAFGKGTTQELSLPCCFNILAVDKADSKCWEYLFGGSEIPIYVPALVASCAELYLTAHAPAPGPSA